MLEHFVSRSSFYDIACFSILDCVSHKDAVITPENISGEVPVLMLLNLIVDHL